MESLIIQEREDQKVAFQTGRGGVHLSRNSKAKQVIAITGGSGYIGRSISRHLAGEFSFILLDLVPPKGTLDPGVVFEKCDVRDYQAVQESLRGVDLVIHTAIIQIPKILQEKNLAYQVNVIGTENVARAVSELARPKGMILASSWHTIGERGLDGVVNESFGYRPDKVEERARLYTLSKIIQESIVRFYDESFEKTSGIIRMGTVLGEDMPPETAANIFIEKGLKGEPLTPYKHSMYRPMFFVDVNDIARAYGRFAEGILYGGIGRNVDSSSHIVNMFIPQPVTILELSRIVVETITRVTMGRIQPRVEIVDKGVDSPFTAEDKDRVWGDMRKAKALLNMAPTTSVEQSIERIVRARLANPQ
jgi:nucleoside-diphosphate-sugar epimerase